MNDLQHVKQKTEIVSNFEFGLSTLHAWIRFIEYVLLISYQLEIRNWSVAKKKNKETMQKAKKRICNEFKEKMGLINN